MVNLKTIKGLTKSQKQKADKIIELLIELKKQGVHPIVIDGGGGSGLEFVRISNNEWLELCDIIEKNYTEESREITSDYIYTPHKTWEVIIPTIVP